MVTNMSPKDYPWIFSDRDWHEALWVESRRDCHGTLSHPSRDCRTPLSSDYAFASWYSRYDILFAEIDGKRGPYVGTLAYVAGYGSNSAPDFIINISMEPRSRFPWIYPPFAIFFVAKKAACEVAARSVPLPENYRLWFWRQCRDWSNRFFNFTTIWSNSSEVFADLHDYTGSQRCTAEERVPRNNARVAKVARSVLAAELDMCEFLMRYCGEAKAQQFIETATRPWTTLAQLKVRPNIAYILNKTAERVLKSRPDHICRRLYQEDLQKYKQQAELALKIDMNLGPPPYSHEPKPHLTRVVMPDISYEKEKESKFLDDPTPIQPYLQPRGQRPWLSICQTDMTQMSKFGLLANKPHGFTSPPSKRSLKRQKIFYESVFLAASKGEIIFRNEYNLLGSFTDTIFELRLPTEAEVCQSQDWKPFFSAAIRLDRRGVQFKMRWAIHAEKRLHKSSKIMNKAFRDFVVLWGSTVYIESIARSKLWGGTKGKRQDLSRTTNNKRIQHYSKLTLGAEMDICEFILTVCSITEADAFLKNRGDRPWCLIQNLTAQTDITEAIDRGAELALAERENYYCYQFYRNYNEQGMTWEDPRWVVPGYFPHPGWGFCWDVYGPRYRMWPADLDSALNLAEHKTALEQVEDEAALKQVENEKIHHLSVSKAVV
jgi:hypothetical protein